MARCSRPRSLPLVLLAALSLCSIAARAAWLGQPCRAPCRSAADHLLIFDESYYVNAARVIAGVRPPSGSTYARAPLGHDPNAEHPQLAKLVIAGSIELFGDGPLAWRLGSLVFGSLAIAGTFALVRAAGGGPWLGLVAAGLMAADNLLLVHSRIGTLDVYALAAMIWAAVLYLRGQPLAAGALIGVGAGFKLVAPYVLVVLVLFELLRRLGPGAVGPPLRRLAGRLALCTSAAVAVFAGLLAVLDLLAPPYDVSAGRALRPGPWHHLAHMLSYAAHQTSPHGPRGIASYPWQWLVDLKPIVYLNINPARPGTGLGHVHPQAHFLGMISPPVLLVGLAGLTLAAWKPARRRRGGEAVVRPGGEAVVRPGEEAGVRPGEGSIGYGGDDAGCAGGEVSVLALAWFLGAFVPFALLSLIWHRTSYLYYMVVVMPGIYLAAADLVCRARRHPKLLAAWTVAVALAAVLMYPFTPLP